MPGALDEVKLHLVDNGENFDNFRRNMGERHEGNVLAFDTETESLNPYCGDRVRLIQIGDTMNGWAFPPTWHGAAMEMLDKWTGEWAAHNLRFDANWLRKMYGWRAPWDRCHDTLTQAHLDDPTRTRALKKVSGLLIDPRAAASQVILEKEMNLNHWDWKTVPIVREGVGSSYWIYAALDPVLTARLHVNFKQTRIDYMGPYELEMGVVRCIADMEWKGARVDLDYCAQMSQVVAEYGAQVRAWVKEVFGVKNPNSTMELIPVFEAMGRTITGRTPKGAKSLDKEQLQRFLIEDETAGNELARTLLQFRKGEKQVGPYFSNFSKMADSEGRVHATIWPCGTRTARMSVTEPALQTLPRKDPTVRDAFIPSDDHVLITIDADQIEMRLAAHFSRDEGLRRAFMESEDFFNTTASAAWQTLITKKDPRRQTFKNGSYAKLYGAGVEKIALTTGVPFAVMQAVMQHFDEAYPGIRRLQRATTNIAQQRSRAEGRGYVKTPTGRRLYVDDSKEYTGMNYLLQSHAAEVLKRGICDVHEVGLGEYLVLPVHDELLLDVPREEATDVKRLLEETLNATGKDYYVPLTWSADIMVDRWGSKYR
jgi:DNA polymerase-1